MDPSLAALLPLAGVVLTILAGLLGASIQRRGEMARWLRAERLRAYTDQLLATDRMMGLLIAKAPEDPVDADALEEIRRAVAICQLLGPDKLYEAATRFHDAVYVDGNYRGESRRTSVARIEARRAYIVEARTALGVKLG
ncbi:MAG: hypothetical protein PIR02_11825 [Microbacterium enclense]